MALLPKSLTARLSEYDRIPHQRPNQIKQHPRKPLKFHGTSSVQTSILSATSRLSANPTAHPGTAPEAPTIAAAPHSPASKASFGSEPTKPRIELYALSHLSCSSPRALLKEIVADTISVFGCDSVTDWIRGPYISAAMKPALMAALMAVPVPKEKLALEPIISLYPEPYL